jgi:hypothetical protein
MTKVKSIDDVAGAHARKTENLTEAEKSARFCRHISDAIERLAARYDRQPWQIRSVLEEMSLRYEYK